MIRSFSRSTAFGLGALLLASASAVSAQYAERPADRLSRYLRELAADPTDSSALIGAGQAALDVGDGNAALGFFARADERSPRNGQVKAGLARALLMVDNPREALKMFDAARSLGVPDLQLAPDRGLAYDLKGDNRRAQQDYELVLSRGANDEVTKRYALSLGITGERDRALQLLDPLLYKRDQGAWRARAFVLALTGDTAGASKIAHQVMPETMARSMDPFLARLASLNAAQKAAAVHLGEMPSNVRFASNTASQPRFSAPKPAFTPAPAPSPTRMGRTQARQPAPLPTPTPTPTPTPAAPPASSPPTALPVEQRGDLDAIIRNLRAQAATSTRVAQATPRAKPTPAAKVTDEAEKPDPKAKAGTTKADTKPAKVAAAEKKKKAEPKNPSRIWVQVAGGANEDTLPKEWTRVSAKAAELKGKGPWTAKNRATNRLLAGPFKSEAEAQAAVAKLRKAGIGAFRWTSEDGEAVEKIGGK